MPVMLGMKRSLELRLKCAMTENQTEGRRIITTHYVLVVILTDHDRFVLVQELRTNLPLAAWR